MSGKAQMVTRVGGYGGNVMGKIEGEGG